MCGGGYTNRDNLILVDILCHGVPSRKVWRKYLDYRRSEDCAQPNNISFRDKHESWKSFSMKFAYSDRSDYIGNTSTDLFIIGFLRNLYLRTSCYDCKYKSLERNTDLTIGDFWEINEFSKNFGWEGTSLVFTHTPIGEGIVFSIANAAKIEEFDDPKIIPNGGLYHSAFYNLDRSAFFKNLDKMSFDELYDHYFGNRFVSKIKRYIARFCNK